MRRDKPAQALHYDSKPFESDPVDSFFARRLAKQMQVDFTAISRHRRKIKALWPRVWDLVPRHLRSVLRHERQEDCCQASKEACHYFGGVPAGRALFDTPDHNE